MTQLPCTVDPCVETTTAHRPAHDISSLRFPVVGAAPLPLTVRRALAAHTEVDLIEGYGLFHPGAAHAGVRLPYQLTAVGKIFKPALQADVAHRRVARELTAAGIPARVVSGSGTGCATC